MNIAAYGSWRSPITPEALVERVVRMSDLWASGDHLWWNESRPAEGGRQVVVRWSEDGGAADVIPAGFSARTTVHEYGGGSFTTDRGQVIFSNLGDQRLWMVDGDREPWPLTPEPPEEGAWRYADMRVTSDGSWIVCVRERHIGHNAVDVVNDLVAVPVGGGEPVPLAGGHDFYAAPRPSPDGDQIAWLTWDHPSMPWDGTQLWLGDVTIGAGAGAGAPAPIHFDSVRLVAGRREESVSQPRWSPDGRLHWVSDRSGWWNLYVDDGGDSGRPLAPRPAEFSRPDWVFGQSTFTFLPDGRLAAVWSQDGIDRLMLIDPSSGAVEPLAVPYTSMESLQPWKGGISAVAASPTEEAAVVTIGRDARSQVVRRSRAAFINPAFVSEAHPLEFPTTGGLRAHAFYYPPANPDFDGPPGERPPLVVMSHGGPTAAASSALDPRIQFWTTRGVAVVDVNYGGSTGYGRAYRERLDGNWGVVDVDDCVNAALHLAEEGSVDRRRLAIRGGSAGGFTTLCALAFRDVFSAGASLYGVADLEILAADTHKFESRYLDRLVGPYPEAQERYRQRSPIHFADRISCPILILQGLDDRVVPPAQAEVVVAALRTMNRPFAYVTFAGEQHGFRRAENIRRAIEVELSFFGEALGFQPADHLEPVVIQNFGERGSKGRSGPTERGRQGPG